MYVSFKVVKIASAKLKNLLLALFLCVGMIGLSGAGIGPVCAAKAAKECQCCPMQPEETCCSAGDEPVPAESPMLPANPAQPQAFQAVPFSRPVLFVLPVPTKISFCLEKVEPSLLSDGPSAQALLCVRT